MRSGIVRVGDRVAGRLVEESDAYQFLYDAAYLQDPQTPPVSLTLPKQAPPHRANSLFPFFFGLPAPRSLPPPSLQLPFLQRRRPPQKFLPPAKPLR